MIKAWLELAVGDLDILGEYGTALENWLASELKGSDSRAERNVSELPKEKQDEFWDIYTDDHWQLSEVFPNILRSSLFVACCSLFEHMLVTLCNLLYRKYKYKEGPPDFRRDILSCAKKYLKDAKIEFPDQTQSWADIVQYNLVRNFIVHNGGKLNNSNKAVKVETFVKAKSSISLNHLKYIQLSENFCPEVINTLRTFFGELLKVLP